MKTTISNLKRNKGMITLIEGMLLLMGAILILLGIIGVILKYWFKMPVPPSPIILLLALGASIALLVFSTMRN